MLHLFYGVFLSRFTMMIRCLTISLWNALFPCTLIFIGPLFLRFFSSKSFAFVNNRVIKSHFARKSWSFLVDNHSADKWKPYSPSEWIPYSLGEWMPYPLDEWKPYSLGEWKPYSLSGWALNVASSPKFPPFFHILGYEIPQSPILFHRFSPHFSEIILSAKWFIFFQCDFLVKHHVVSENKCIFAAN